MSRPYPNRARRRKGRPPPHGRRKPRPRGFTAHGLGNFYDGLLPDVRGPARREMFNEIGDGTAALAALTCGALGLASGGIAASFVAAAAGYAATLGLLVKGRFIRR